MDPRLIITIVGYSLATLFTLGLALFVYIRGPKKKLNILFLLMSLSIAAFEISHVLGISVADHELSRMILMWNLANIFIVIFIAHWVVEIIGNAREQRFPLIAIYASGIILLVFHLIYPETFLLSSVAKMYLPNYYVPGPYYLLMRMYFNVVAVYFFYELIVAYRRTDDPIQKNRLKYVFAGLIFGFIVGSSALFLIYNIQIDPLWSMFFGLYTLPFAYAILKYDLMDIRIVAKRALGYALMVGSLSVVITLLSFSNEVIVENLPGFPLWLIPAFASIAAVSIGVFVWRKVRETDLLKYEFITIITHKFRTPLTHIKWSTDLLLSAAATAAQKAELENIKISGSRLVTLTNQLAALADTDSGENQGYQWTRVELEGFIRDILNHEKGQLAKKKLSLTTHFEDPLATCLIDKSKMAFVIATILDNALSYTKEGGTIDVSLVRSGKKASISISDNGIGISKEELRYVFTKFFRTEGAQQLDTEGMGIGLFMVKKIIERHGGTITAYSEGKGHGSTFTIELPLN